MRAVLDACVLVPPVLREILIGCAGEGLYTPLWSARILEEWARAARRHGPASEVIARGEIAALRAVFPDAMLPPAPGVERRIHLPDENDIHVLAVAIAGQADAIVTFNAADFPRGALAAEGIARRDPDGMIWEFWSHAPESVERVVAQVQARAEQIGGAPRPMRGLLKRAGLPRLARAMAG